MFWFCVGIMISVLWAIFILPKKEGSAPVLRPTLYPVVYKGMIIVPVNRRKAVHVHHWIVCLLICLVSFRCSVPNIVFGFSLGMCVQGLFYKDRFHFIGDNPYTCKQLHST